MDTALDYLARGWSVLPLEPRSKIPATSTIRWTRGTSSWSTYRARHATADEVAAWAEHEPEHNIGIALGETSDNLVALDRDAELPAGICIPPTATVRTGRGCHFYARAEAPVATQLFPWGELRGEGTYIVAPQSTHPSGRRYEWESTPDEGIATLEAFELPPLVSRVRAEGSSPSTGIWATWPTRDTQGMAPLFAAALGVVDFAGVGKPFLCLLHPESTPSATLWPRADNGRLLYHDFHGKPEWLALPTVRAFLAGRQGRLSNSEFVVWSLRLECEAGIRERAFVPACELPADAAAGLRTVWNGFLELLRCRWTHTPGAPAPFAHRFAACWSGCSRTTVQRYFAELRRLGLVRHAGRDVRGTALWLPGEEVGPLRPTR
jgi:hypothetical protein